MKLRENAGKMLFLVPRTYYALNKSNSLSAFPDVALNSNIQEFSLKGQRISWQPQAASYLQMGGPDAARSD